MSSLQVFTVLSLIMFTYCTNSQEKKTVFLPNVEVDSNGIPLDSNQFYFPIELFDQKNYNSFKTSFIDDSYDANLVGYHSEFLRKVYEPILYKECFEVNAFRLIWYRTFENPLIIRIEKSENQYKLYWKLTDGAGGYNLGELYVSGNRDVGEKIWNNFNFLLQHFGFWESKTLVSEIIALDEDKWIFEGRKDNKYHVILRNSGLFYPCRFLVNQINIDSTKLKPTDPYQNSKIETKEHGVVYTLVEEFPEFSFKGLNFNEYFQSEIERIKFAKSFKEGKLYIQFIVYEDGSLRDIQVIRGLNNEIDNNVKEIFARMPKWKPGKNNSEKVKVQVISSIHLKK